MSVRSPELWKIYIQHPLFRGIVLLREKKAADSYLVTLMWAIAPIIQSLKKFNIAALWFKQGSEILGTILNHFLFFVGIIRNAQNVRTIPK